MPYTRAALAERCTLLRTEYKRIRRKGAALLEEEEESKPMREENW